MWLRGYSFSHPHAFVSLCFDFMQKSQRLDPIFSDGPSTEDLDIHLEPLVRRWIPGSRRGDYFVMFDYCFHSYRLLLYVLRMSNDYLSACRLMFFFDPTPCVLLMNPTQMGLSS